MAKATMEYQFSRGPQQSLEITPLGAAVVEALPDQKKVKQIERDFKQRKVCPSSAIFTASEVEDWYKAHGESVSAIQHGVKGVTEKVRKPARRK